MEEGMVAVVCVCVGGGHNEVSVSGLFLSFAVCLQNCF